MRLLIALSIATLCATLGAHALPTLVGPVNCSQAEQLIEELEGAQAVGALSKEYPLCTTEEQWVARCKEATQAIRMLKRVNKECISGLSQQVLGAILRTRSQMLDSSCKPASDEFKQTLGLSQCIQSNGLDELRQSEIKSALVTQVVGDATYTETKERLKACCCSVPQARAYITNTVQEKCPDFAKISGDHIDSYVSEAFGMICADLSKFDCNHTSPINIEGVQLRSMSNLVPALRLVKLIDEA